MKVDGVLAWSQVVKVEINGDTCALVPDRCGADRFSLRVFEFHIGFGPGFGRGFGRDHWCESQQQKRQRRGVGWIFHLRASCNGEDYSQSQAGVCLR